jgi:uncharacterized membrane protein YsdA (DUF1294 family)
MNLALYLLLINAITFVAYWLDKRAAINGQWRIPEASLLMLGFAGGTPAALAAQQKLRHKTRKGSFQFKFWALTLVQLGLLAFQPQMLKEILTRAFS